MTAGSYTDASTGIKLKTWDATDGGAYSFGLALPADALTKDATEYIGLLVGREFSTPVTPCSRCISAAPSQMPPRPGIAVFPTASLAR